MRVIYVLLAASRSAVAAWWIRRPSRPRPRRRRRHRAPPSVDPRTPLLTIGYDTPNPSYQDMLQYAVHAAEARAPGVQYDVYAMLPAGGDAAQAQSSAVEVMRAITRSGRAGFACPPRAAHGTGGSCAPGACLRPLNHLTPAGARSVPDRGTGLRFDHRLQLGLRLAGHQVPALRAAALHHAQCVQRRGRGLRLRGRDIAPRGAVAATRAMGAAARLLDAEFRDIHGVHHAGAGLAAGLRGGDRHLYAADLGGAARLAGVGREADPPARQPRSCWASPGWRCWSASVRPNRHRAGCRVCWQAVSPPCCSPSGAVIAKRAPLGHAAGGRRRMAGAARHRASAGTGAWESRTGRW